MKFIRYLALFAMCTCMATAQNPYGNTILNPSGTVMTATSQTSAAIAMGQSWSLCTVTLTGTSLTTATFGVVASSDNGATYNATPPMWLVATPGTTATTMTATTNSVYQFNCGTFQYIKFVTSGTFTGTNINLLLTASPNASAKSSSGGGGGITLTTTGTSGASTLTGTVLNVPVYSGGAMVNITSLVTMTPSGGAASIVGNSYVVGTAFATLNISAIPAGYTHLKIHMKGQQSGASADNIWAQFNGDTAANYGRQFFFANGGTAQNPGINTAVAKANYCWMSGTSAASSSGSVSDMLIPDFANATWSKVVRCEDEGFLNANAVTGLTVDIASGYWTGTAAITSILLGTASANNFVAGTSFQVYGII